VSEPLGYKVVTIGFALYSTPSVLRLYLRILRYFRQIECVYDWTMKCSFLKKDMTFQIFLIKLIRNQKSKTLRYKVLKSSSASVNLKQISS